MAQDKPLPVWHQQLCSHIGSFGTMDEAMAARKMYEQGMSVNRAVKAIEAKRKAILN